MRLIRRERAASSRKDGKRRSSNSLRRVNTLELLEGRVLLTANSSAAISAWHNSLNPLDVNHDNRVTPRDALLIINDLLTNGTHKDGTPAASAASAVVGLAAASPAPSYALDVNGDGMVSPRDLLAVINQQAVTKLVQVTSFATDLAHNPISSIPVGQNFLIETDVLDLRTPASAALGVFATFDDVTYANASLGGTNLVSVSSSATVNFDPFFSLVHSSDLSTPGVINKVGAAASNATPPFNWPPVNAPVVAQPVWNVAATANIAGSETITPSFDDTPTNDGTLLYGQDNEVTIDQIDFVGTTLTITGQPSVSISSTSAFESNSGPTPFVFTVSLSPASNQTVTVTYQTADGTPPNNATVAENDYVPTSGTVTLTGGQPALITVTVNSDTVAEPSETFDVNLLSVTSGNAVLGTAVGVGTIENNNVTPALSIGNVIANDVGPGSHADFTVNLSAPASNTVMVNFATSPGSGPGGATDPGDYTGTSGILTFSIGQQSKTISVPITPDSGEDGSETFTMTLSSPSNATLQNTTATGTIQPAFPVPTLLITPNVSLLEGSPPNNTVFMFTASLSNSPGNTPVVVQFSTADGTSSNPALNATVADNDYLLASGTLTFSSSALSQTIPVTVIGDTRAEPSENFTVNLTPVSGATGTAQGVGTILNNNGPPTLTIDDVSVIGGTSGIKNAVFTVSLSSAPPQPVFVGFATTDGTAVSTGSTPDYIAVAGQFTLDSSHLQYFITVPVIGDPTAEENESFSVVLSGIHSDGPVVVGNSQATATIVEQGLSISDAAVVAGNSGTASAVFTVTLSTPQGHDVKVGFATADGNSPTAANNATTADGDYTQASGTLTFLAGTNTPQTISVPIGADTTVEPNETFFVNLTPVPGETTAIFSGTGTGTILNNFGQQALIRLQLSKPNLDATNSANWLPTGSVLNVNDNFMLDVFVQDIQAVPQGILAAYLNAVYNSTLVSATGPITYGSHFTVAQSGSTSTPGQIAEAGATSDSLTPPAQPGAEELLLSVPMKANDVGLANFMALPASNPNHSVFEYLNDQPIPTSSINFAGTSINIGSNVFSFTSDTLSVANPEGNSGQTPFVFKIERFLPGNQIAMVQFSTADGTGPAGATTADGDYVAPSGTSTTLTFAAGDTASQSITVLVNGNTTDEPDETFSVNLKSLTPGVFASSSAAVGTILNDDPHVGLTVSDATANEGQNLTFTFSLSAVSGKTVTVAYNTADILPSGPNNASAGTDYQATSGIVSFNPGETKKTITVAGLPDNLPNEQPIESFLLNLGSPSNVILPTSSIEGHIIDIPPATLSGSVYVDINNDGIRESTEAGIANVPITASATINGTSTSQTTLTKADGTFTFVGLQPGVSYTVTETQPGFFVDGKDTYPSGAISQTNDQFTGIVLAPSQQASGYNFGELGLRPQFAIAFFNRRAFFSTDVVTSQFGVPGTTLNLLGGNVWISFDGGWQGQRTIQAAFNPAQGSAAMTLYDFNLNPVAFSVPTATGAQLQFNGSGVTYFLEVSGTNSNVSLSINDAQLATNLTQPQGATVGSNSTTTGNSSPPSTNTSSPTATNGVTSTFASSAVMAAPTVEPLAASADDSTDATDAALANEDDWVTPLLAA